LYTDLGRDNFVAGAELVNYGTAVRQCGGTAVRR
jgi:hypothetical protein